MTRTTEEIRSAVKEAYGARARDAASCCGGSACDSVSHYGERELSMVPETAVTYGCGNPVAIASLQSGETVLDLGSGAGFDCLLAAERVGPAGRVIGVDMTPDMISLARDNAAKVGATNVEFRSGLIEDLPVEDESVDVVISNCVINLSPDKDAVFREAFRALRPGGRFMVADVVLNHELSQAEQDDLEKWAGCVSGALLRDDYVARLQAAGFEAVTIDAATDAQEAWLSAHVSARRPAR